MSLTLQNLEGALAGKWEDLPDDFECPECGVGKEDYVEFAD
jgi:rubredoxin